MGFLPAFGRCRICVVLSLAASAFLMTACISQVKKEPSTSYKQVQRDNKRLQKKLAKTQLRLLEKDAQIKGLEERLTAQQKMLDEAVLEVVRAKAKLRSMESRAEAASNMAEAEIAVKALKMQLGGGKRDPDVLKAEKLLKMSALEFKKENYGGALYLTSQAKSHIKARQMRIGGGKQMAAFKGEVLFAQPLPLQVLKTGHLRERPDAKGKIVTRLRRGAWVVGYSYKREWVRVRSEDGRSGWIVQSLVGGR